MHSAFVQFGKYLRIKRNFILFSLLSVGVPTGVAFIWQFGNYGGLIFASFLFVVGLCAGLLWGLLMWAFFVKGFK